ncbi:High Affinity Immunoglobulin Alpha And Immunoglobulin Mu Fc Receptor [Manis pentadactyla]|nr:High Affinity Immunoglobulin Alpha And Immunoglobulin Mu Fc Receptor [Manis pentadactyla]
MDILMDASKRTRYQDGTLTKGVAGLRCVDKMTSRVDSEKQRTSAPAGQSVSKLQALQRNPSLVGCQFPGKTLQRKVQPSTSKASGIHTGTKICQGRLPSVSSFQTKKPEDIQASASQREEKKSSSGFYFWSEMDGKAPTEPGEQKCFLQVTSQRAGWTMQILFTLCLLHAANALKGPRLVTGEPGGAVTIQCRYAPLSIYRHQRKYWCRLNPLTWICHTIVSTNSYTHRQYHGRVALTDFRHSGLFVVRLSQLSPDDVGYYRCGVGNQNDILFFSMNLTISAGMGRGLVGQVGKENARKQKVQEGSREEALEHKGRTSPSAGVWTLGPSGLETAAAEGSADGDLDTADGDRGPQATPSQAPASGPQRPLGKGSSMKSASPEEKSISRVLTPVSTMLLPLMFVALALLQRKLQRKQMSQEAGRAAGVTLVRMTHLLACQPDCPGEGPWTLNMEGSAAQTPWKENQDQTL